MNVSPTPAVLPTVLTASSCPTITNVSANLASQAGGVRTGSVCVSPSLVRAEESVLCPAPLHWDTPAHVNLVMLGQIVKGACPVGSCPATMEVAVHLPQGERVAAACKVMAGLSVSITVRRAAPPSPVGMEGCALKRPAFHTSTASVPVALLVNGASRVEEPLSPQHPHALLRIVMEKPMMVFVTRNATHSFVAGMAVTVL